ncbi:MAG: trp operon repressor [Holosporales bacterium]|jgi:TrpR-related protein YerC/YecD|nr:trp operon repressor [Holosporales bacterium]
MTDHHHGGADLFEAIAILENADEAKRFFTDLCTPREIELFKERYAVCQLLYSGAFSYRAISKMTGASTTTILRVAKFLNDEPYKGYISILEKIQKGGEKGNVEENNCS